jgi:hypothetical protein
VTLSCLSLCQLPLYSVTALALFPVATGGLNRRMSYPCFFLWSRADMNVIRSLFACADLALLRVTCMSSSQTCVLLVSLELVVVE